MLYFYIRSNWSVFLEGISISVQQNCYGHVWKLLKAIFFAAFAKHIIHVFPCTQNKNVRTIFDYCHKSIWFWWWKSYVKRTKKNHARTNNSMNLFIKSSVKESLYRITSIVSRCLVGYPTIGVVNGFLFYFSLESVSSLWLY